MQHLENYIFLFLSRWCYINWIVLCWLSSCGLVVSLLSYHALIPMIFYALLAFSLPSLYQMGLNVADFENASKMLEYDWDEDEYNK